MTDIIFSHSRMAAWRRCRLRYKWLYEDNYVPDPTLGQVKGSVGHSALASWYSNMSIPQEDRRNIAMEAASQKLFEYEQLMSSDLQEEWDLLQLVLDRYFEWAYYNDKFDAVLGIEEKFLFKVYDHTLKGFIDGIVTIKGVNWLLEHKFMAQARTKHLELDPQVSIYLYAARHMGYNPRGVLYNVVRMGKGGISEREPVVRLPVFRNNEGLVAIEAEMVNQMEDMKNFHENAGRVYRTPTENCSWDCGFFGACLSINDIGEAESVLRTIPKMKEPVEIFEEETND